ASVSCPREIARRLDEAFAAPATPGVAYEVRTLDEPNLASAHLLPAAAEISGDWAGALMPIRAAAFLTLPGLPGVAPPGALWLLPRAPPTADAAAQRALC